MCDVNSTTVSTGHTFSESLTNDKIKLKLADRVISWLYTSTPTKAIVWLKNVQELHIIVEFQTQQETYLQKDAL